MNVRFFLLLGVTIWLFQGCAHHTNMGQSFRGCNGVYKVAPYSLESLDQKNRCDNYNKDTK